MDVVPLHYVVLEIQVAFRSDDGVRVVPVGPPQDELVLLWPVHPGLNGALDRFPNNAKPIRHLVRMLVHHDLELLLDVGEIGLAAYGEPALRRVAATGASRPAVSNMQQRACDDLEAIMSALPLAIGDHSTSPERLQLCPVPNYIV